MGSHIKMEEQVRRLQSENKKHKEKKGALKHLRVNVTDVAEITAQEEINVQLMASNARSAKK